MPTGFTSCADIENRETCKTFRNTPRQPFKFQSSYQYYL